MIESFITLKVVKMGREGGGPFSQIAWTPVHKGAVFRFRIDIHSPARGLDLSQFNKVASLWALTAEAQKAAGLNVTTRPT